MTKGSLYYYFRNKQEILFFCHDYSLDMLLELLAEVKRSPARADVRLRHLIEGFVAGDRGRAPGDAPHPGRAGPVAGSAAPGGGQARSLRPGAAGAGPRGHGAGPLCAGRPQAARLRGTRDHQLDHPLVLAEGPLPIRRHRPGLRRLRARRPAR